MENLTVERYFNMVKPLPIQVKLELIHALAESIRRDFNKQEIDKEQLLDEVSGAWSGMDDDIIEEIYKSRS